MERVAFIGHHAGRYGAPMVLLHLLRWMRANGKVDFDVHIVEGGALLKDYAETAPVVLNGRLLSPEGTERSRGFLRSLSGSLGSRSPKDRYALIYSNTITNGSVVERLRKEHGAPVITHVHEMDYWVERAGKKNWQLVERQTDLFIAASVPVAEMLERRGIPVDRIRIIEEFISTDGMSSAPQDRMAVRSKLGITEDAFVVAGGGAETLRKGKDLFVQLAGQVSRSLEGRQPYFLWVGYGLDPEAAYWAAHDARTLGIEGRIIWTGEVDDPLTYFAACDAFALLSREDPFPLVCIEAALLGKPVACFRGSGGIPYLVEKDAGAAVPYLDIDAMARELVEWSSNRELRDGLGRRACEKVKQRYSVDVQAPRIHALILEMAGKDTGSRTVAR